MRAAASFYYAFGFLSTVEYALAFPDAQKAKTFLHLWDRGGRQNLGIGKNTSTSLVCIAFWGQH